MARVAAPRSPGLARSITLACSSCGAGPAASRAEASATLAVPISAATTADGVGTATGAQGGGRQPAQRPAALAGQLQQGRFIGLAVDAGQPGDGLLRQVEALQLLVHAAAPAGPGWCGVRSRSRATAGRWVPAAAGSALHGDQQLVRRIAVAGGQGLNWRQPAAGLELQPAATALVLLDTSWLGIPGRSLIRALQSPPGPRRQPHRVPN